MYIKELNSIIRPPYLGGSEWNIKGIKPLTFILGKNGSGKTSLISALTAYLKRRVVTPQEANIVFDARLAVPELYIACDKISAERGGLFRAEAGIANQISREPDYLYNSRQGSVSSDFRAQVSSRYEKLLAVLAQNDSPQEDRPFDKINKIVASLNKLLPAKYEVSKSDSSFSILKKGTAEAVPFEKLSSGEIEMFTLGLECLISANWKHPAENVHKVLLIDEPDVHIHPDLQIKFLEFIYQLIADYPIQVIIGTHSTIFIANISQPANTSIIWMHDEVKDLVAETRNDFTKEIATIVGSNFALQLILNHKIVLVEGADDEKIWNQAIRSAQGKLKIYVYKCDGKDRMRGLEASLDKLLKALCDPEVNSTFVLSIRDRDYGEPEIDNRVFVKRKKLACHEIENCVLSEEYLDKYTKTIEEIGFVDDRLNADIKDRFRDINRSIAAENDHHWQNKIGQIIGQIYSGNLLDQASAEFSIINFIGPELLGLLRNNVNAEEQ